jgi:SOS response regulatory protein OraA/RecX
LLDDARYSRAKVAGLRARGASARAIRHKLELAGVARSNVDTALSEGADDEGDAELEAACRLLKRRRRGRTRTAADRAELEKDFTALARAGFSLRVARAALEQTSEAGSLRSAHFVGDD